MEFKKISVNVTTEAKEVITNVETVAPFNNVVNESAFVAMVQRNILDIQRNEYGKAITAVKECLFSGETPTAVQIEKAECASLAIPVIDKLLTELEEVKHDSTLPNILACHLVNRSYFLPVATVDKLLRDYHASLVDSSDKVTIDGATQQKAITAIKQEVKRVLAVYSTEKDSIFKKWSINLSNRDIVNLCSWFYKDITRNKENGVFSGQYQTDGGKKVNYAPLQGYLQRLVFLRLQHSTTAEK